MSPLRRVTLATRCLLRLAVTALVAMLFAGCQAGVVNTEKPDGAGTEEPDAGAECYRPRQGCVTDEARWTDDGRLEITYTNNCKGKIVLRSCMRRSHSHPLAAINAETCEDYWFLLAGGWKESHTSVTDELTGEYSYRYNGVSESAYESCKVPGWNDPMFETTGLKAGKPTDPELPGTSDDGGTIGEASEVPTVMYGEESLNKRIGVVNIHADGQPAGATFTINVDVRDHECEDGDQVAILVRRSSDWEEVFRGEILNRWQSRSFTATVGYHYTIAAIALNGTGFKGNCSHADRNTGQMRVYGSGSLAFFQYAKWDAPGGSGSVGVVNVIPR